MKLVALALGLLLMSSVCFAEVTGEVIGKSIDDNGNILIKTQYRIDGAEVPSRYPQENGKYYWVTRYTVMNFAGMTEVEQNARILKDVSEFAKSLITKKYVAEANGKLELKTIVGQKVTETTSTVKPTPTLEWSISTTGIIDAKAVTATPPTI
jgi:hypothetical protein